jgi:hypothetical protein
MMGGGVRKIRAVFALLFAVTPLSCAHNADAWKLSLRRMTEEGIPEAQALDIAEATLRYQIDTYGGAKELPSTTYIVKIFHQKPPRDFLVRFKHHQPPVRKSSLFVGGDKVYFSVGEIERFSGIRAEVFAGYHVGNTGGGGSRYTLELEDGRWRVINMERVIQY